MMRSAESARVALTTTAFTGEARRLAHVLVERRLAACVNIVPSITSVYRWKDTIVETQEVLLIIKTSTERVPAVEETLQELHSYETPEFVAIKIESGSQPYLDWLLSSVVQ